ncbi:hypothetical protein C8R44DRAFT_790986 [Mycena epipterygia]|nr:hypothetical protein C8R44DRAFT_790986 [Mycena epipterygia]
MILLRRFHWMTMIFKHCPHCEEDLGPKGHNLILSFDGTSNQYGNKNTNVIELYARIDKKDGSQLTYYNSGIGTYARPSWRSYKYWKQVIDNRIDLAIAWNFEKGVLAGYRWLCNHYRPGHKIFLFGFSRGAHQVRALAAMIAKVGLILPGNEEQIPFAYELYADLKAHSNKGSDEGKSAQFFKNTFCREDVRIHFLGAWDAVSSIGIVRGKNLPGTDTFDDNNICFFRHALSLDERRVKFIPEYICGEKSYEEMRPEGSLSEPRVKEVWFAGTHSDVGGGNEKNETLTNGAVPVLWMGHEALRAGLRLKKSVHGDSDWKWEQLERSEPTESLTGLWRFFELLPIKRLSYKDPSMTRRPHLGKGRVIQPGQKIHASVAFIKDYQPKATLPEETIEWEDILEKGNKDGISWIQGLEHILELDLFDLSPKSVLQVIANAMSNDTDLDRLDFLTSIREGAASIAKAEPALQSFTKMLLSDSITRRERTGKILLALAGYEAVRRALTWTKVINAYATVDVPEPPHIHAVFELLSLLSRDGIRHLNFKEPDATWLALETILERLPENDPQAAHNRFVFGECNCIRYLRGRTGIKDGVSTFEHYFRHSLRTSQSPSPKSTLPPYLDKAIDTYRVAMIGLADSATPSFRDRRLECLVKLATCLQARFVEMGSRADLDDVIGLLRKELAGHQQQSSGREVILTCLADTLVERFKQSKNSQDIDQAIANYRDVLTYHPEPGPGCGIALNNLAGALYEQCKQEDFKNLNECIQRYREGLILISRSDPTRARSLTNLADAIQKIVDDTKAIDEAIRLHKEASSLCLPIDFSTSLNNLSESFYEKYKNSGNLPAIREGVTHFNYFLDLHNSDRSLIAGVTLELHRLLGEIPGRRPDREVGNLIDGDNRAWLAPDPDIKYGFTIRNTSNHDLFPYLFYFDPDDYTISCLYSPLQQMPLRELLTVGMGAEPAFEFALPQGMTSSAGFLKIFAFTEYVDLSWIQLDLSPWETVQAPRWRVFNEETLRNGDAHWADLVVTVIMHEGE